MSGLELASHVPCSALESIEFSEIIVVLVVVLRDRICLDSAIGILEGAIAIDNWMVYWNYSACSVELIEVL